MIAKQIMVRNVITIDAEATVKNAANIMSREEIGSLVVTQQGKLVGIVTERDLLTRVVAIGRNPEATEVKHVMSKPLITGDPDVDVADAARLMVGRGVKKLPIVDRETLVGIVTLTDLCRVQPEIMEGLVTDPSMQKLPRRFLKRLSKKYFRT